MLRRNRAKNADSVRYSGWRPPLIAGWFLELVTVIGQRKEFKGLKIRAVVEAALLAFATEEELKEVDFLRDKGERKDVVSLSTQAARKED
jgi:hypothetical protein